MPTLIPFDRRLDTATRWHCPEPAPADRYLHFTDAETAQVIAASGQLTTSFREKVMRRGVFAVPVGGQYLPAMQCGAWGATHGRPVTVAVVFTTRRPPAWSEPREAHWMTETLAVEVAEVISRQAGVELLCDRLRHAWRLADGSRFCRSCKWSGGCRRPRPVEDYPMRPFPSLPLGHLPTSPQRGTLAAVIPDVAALAVELARRRDGRSLQVHGPAHWRQVATAGLRLCQEVPQADPLVVYAFAVLHDAARLHDGLEPHHGSRMARQLDELRTAGLLVLADGPAEVLRVAVRHHPEGYITDHPTVGVCWDADRLDLWRTGIRPWPGGLSTEAGRELVEWARTLRTQALDWEALWAAYSGVGEAVP